MFERPRAGERALLVHVSQNRVDLLEQATELELLAESSGAELILSLPAIRKMAEPRYLIGAGTVDELVALVKEANIELVIVGAPLSPSQERNLERILCCRVIDRRGLILDIFAQRASTIEGRLQVELAQLQHLSTRLVRGWTHLERQKGGIGLRGPGETQLETDRRLLAARVKLLNKKIDQVQQQRLGRRERRRKNDVLTVSIVGYTNAGKSTLFNALTNASAYVADQLFATLDPTSRRLHLAEGEDIVLSDTVGFISDLPHELIVAFRATLEETRDADLLLHVIDAADPLKHQLMAEVNHVLKEIDAHERPTLLVYNKIDCLDEPEQFTQRDAAGHVVACGVSALKHQGFAELCSAIAERVGAGLVTGWVSLPAAQAKVRAQLYELGIVREEQISPIGDYHLNLEMTQHRYKALSQQLGADFDLQAEARL